MVRFARRSFLAILVNCERQRRSPGLMRIVVSECTHFCEVARILLTPYEMRLFVLALFGLLLPQVSAQAKVPSEIPFQYRDGLIWLKVDVTGKSKPLNFL